MMKHGVLAVLLFLLPACGGGGSAGPTVDAGPLEPPAECALGAPPAEFVYPTGPYGDEVGETFEDFTLEDCDGNNVRFSDILAQSRLVLVDVAAGWCQPCVEEARKLETEIFREFCPQDFQVIQILFQDEQSRPATSLFCNEWRTEFHLTFPVLMDPVFIMEKYLADVSSQTPVNFLIDAGGVIVFKETGTPGGDLPDRIRDLLAE